MTHNRKDHAEELAFVEERDLTLIAALFAIILVAGGAFIFNSASTRYTTTASYGAPPAPNTVPIMTPATVPVPNIAPKQ